MVRQEIDSKWGLLISEGISGYKSFRISSNCIPDLFIGVDSKNLRCLILKLPQGYNADFQSVVKDNISLEIFSETKWIVLKLLNLNYTEIFNDLVISFYNCIKDLSDVRIYTSELINNFYKWCEFFNESKVERLSLEEVQGIFGELFVLRKYISESSSTNINSLLNSWTGPSGKTHDFEMPCYDLEIKTKEINITDIHISSETQLQNKQGKGLFLIIISLIINSEDAIPLKSLVLNIRDIIIDKEGDISLLLNALILKNLTLQNIHEYNDSRFEVKSVITYDCLIKGFPLLIRSNIPSEISRLKYSLTSDLPSKFISDIIEF